MLVVLAWIAMLCLYCDARYLGEEDQMIQVGSGEEFIDDEVVPNGTEDTGDEFFLTVRRKTYDVAPSESDYESDAANNIEEIN
ncbi:hypothetical protein L5515_016951 [Caenorhabditis briggsae]|uniref:Uncharacterized protein n=1 Tax=Caenorhabditis briggsae TaxID=6238 RepID=A0AAE9F7C3_CAEBR|nr:hypothetical protein L5515_016951 [Caenorhabditis briggsae]